MELPHIGKYCQRKDCHQLDFLPFNCIHCKQTFCESHWKLQDHECKVEFKDLDARAISCPICMTVLNSRGRNPDLVVEEHLSKGCEKAKQEQNLLKKAKANHCSVSGCKRKELTPVLCSKCFKNYCLKHRHDLDHNCSALGSGKKSPMSSSGRAALQRLQSCKNESVEGMNEDEQLQFAISESLKQDRNNALCALS